MNRVIGSLFLIIVLSSFVVASSTSVGFVIRDEDESAIEEYSKPRSFLSDYGVYLIGALVILGVIVFLKFKKKPKSKKSTSRKAVKKKNVSKGVSRRAPSKAKK